MWTVGIDGPRVFWVVPDQFKMFEGRSTLGLDGKVVERTVYIVVEQFKALEPLSTLGLNDLRP